MKPQYRKSPLCLSSALCAALLAAHQMADAALVTPSQFSFGAYTSVQMNVDAGGQNILGDAAHEPTIAVDPNNPNKLVAGWKQFASVLSGNRQGGWAYSDDGGKLWHFRGSHAG